MRRKTAQLTDDQTRDVLTQGLWGTLATADAEGHPYATPMNYVYTNGVIYLHAAKEGHKLDNIRDNPNVCFSVVTTAVVHPDRFDTEYASADVFGTAGVITDSAEKQAALAALMQKYSPDYAAEAVRYVEKNIARTAVIAIHITGISGKHNQ